MRFMPVQSAPVQRVHSGAAEREGGVDPQIWGWIKKTFRKVAPKINPVVAFAKSIDKRVMEGQKARCRRDHFSNSAQQACMRRAEAHYRRRWG